MPIGPKILLKLVKEKKLVEDLSERELTNPEGTGFDLRLGEIYEIKGNGFLGIEERKTPNTEVLATYIKGKNRTFSFKPGSYYLVKTIESVNLPESIGGYLFPRSTIFRSGLLQGLSQIAPGYSGQLVTSIANVGPCEVEIELGARFMHIQFEYVEGGGSSYRGQWQGGRVLMKKKEKQV
ncbi:MAG: Deoxycytidine deaminase [Microgenomates group bacterium GW2011_GWC1_37_8]|uniref:Deoxycytidine deaminase n=1 Tax=Candidatus Woesebacteria bacterium GW2011_GWB1_38_8 TaxID=1618570 RepID=A0A0G0LB95_9BACT|nr:MAG: Deoxycytidine deaminase [Microgenomates group bacterium GW2011_GWC1_37_8]KKQ85115.1 MAG: Deoxycytidine deaminase [Candidatus Woesebacteria bacterium GW2011_GWB1_38_8]